MRRSAAGKAKPAAKGGKSPAVQRAKPAKPAKRGRPALDEELDSGDSGDEEAAQHAAMLADEDEEDEETETADERRVRLAKEMITAMDAAATRRREGGADASGVARGAHADEVAQELEEDALRRTGQLRCLAASQLRGSELDPTANRVLRGPRLSATCVAVAPDESFVVCGSKDGALNKWDLQTGEAIKFRGGRVAAMHGGGDDGSAAASGTSSTGSHQTGHLSDVLSVLVSADSQLIVSGGRDGAILLWDCRTGGVVQQFRGHKMPVTALTRRRDMDGPEMYSGGDDRTARVWDLEQRGYVETLYGHQEAICALDALSDQQILSASADRTVRLWKVAEETQLIFANGHKAPVDCAALLHAEAFVSGSQDGSLTLWSAKRKRPLTTTPLAHGVAPWGGPCWLTSLASPPLSDVLVSGSCDGHLRFWECDETERQLMPLLSTPITGFVNGLAVAPSGKFLAAAVGQEHRLGRWFKIREARNSVVIVPLPEPLHAKPRLGEKVFVPGEKASRARRQAAGEDEQDLLDEAEEEEMEAHSGDVSDDDDGDL